MEVKDVSFSYDKDSPIVFENINFSIEKGDVLCILGPNGTGKTTLIKTINGLHDVNSGTVSHGYQNECSKDIKKLKRLTKNQGNNFLFQKSIMVNGIGVFHSATPQTMAVCIHAWLRVGR